MRDSSVKFTFNLVPLRIASIRADRESSDAPKEFPFVGADGTTIGSGGIGGGGMGGVGGGARLTGGIATAPGTGASGSEKAGAGE